MNWGDPYFRTPRQIQFIAGLWDKLTMHLSHSGWSNISRCKGFRNMMRLEIFALWFHQTWLAGKSPMNGAFDRKIIYQWSIFHCHVDYRRVPWKLSQTSSEVSNCLIWDGFPVWNHLCSIIRQCTCQEHPRRNSLCAIRPRMEQWFLKSISPAASFVDDPWPWQILRNYPNYLQ